MPSELFMCNKKPIDMFFVSSHLLWATSHLFSRRKPNIKDERKDHGTVDESSSEQQICELGDYTLIVRKIWSPRPSAIGSYGRQADEIILSLKIFKIL